MHYWGDEWFEENGADLYRAINLHIKWCRRYGRIKMTGKEKYGTYRTELVQLWDGGLHYLICKHLIRIKFPFIYWKIDPIIKKVTKFIGVRYLFVRYQCFVANVVTQILCKRYPNLTDELIIDNDLYKCVKPLPVFGKVDGKEIYKKYWK